MADHKMVQQMFRQAERAKSQPARLREIVEAACAALTLHAEIEEAHLYPVMRQAGKDTGTIAEAYIEHASAKQLIAELEGGDPRQEDYAARFKVLGEYVKHHVKEEEREIFPKARRARADFAPLLAALVARDEAVMADGAQAQSARSSASGARRRPVAPAAAPADPGTRGRAGRGRKGDADITKAATRAQQDEGEHRAGTSRIDETSNVESESPRRGRRGREGSVEQENDTFGRDSDSQEADTGDTRTDDR